MGRSRRAVTAALGLFWTAQLSSGAAEAQDASAAETAAARSLAVEGLKLAQAGDCDEAVPKLERAEKLYHSAVVAARLGECYVTVGRLVEGTEILRKTLREPLPPDPAPALLKALERAQKTLDAAKPRIAGLTIKVAAVSDLSVKVDGNVVAGALLDTEIPSDPGEHTIEASAPSFLRSATRISVGEGERKTVTLTLTRDPDAPVQVLPTPAVLQPRRASAPPARPQRRETRPAPPPPVEEAPNRTASYVALGAGFVGVGVGSALGLMTLSRRDDLKDVCPEGACSEEQQADLDEAKRFGNLSTVGFGVGAAGLVLGTVLYFTAGPSSPSEGASLRRPLLAPRARTQLAIGPNQLRLSTEF